MTVIVAVVEFDEKYRKLPTWQKTRSAGIFPEIPTINLSGINARFEESPSEDTPLRVPDTPVVSAAKYPERGRREGMNCESVTSVSYSIVDTINRLLSRMNCGEDSFDFCLPTATFMTGGGSWSRRSPGTRIYRFSGRETAIIPMLTQVQRTCEGNRETPSVTGGKFISFYHGRSSSCFLFIEVSAPMSVVTQLIAWCLRDSFLTKTK